MKDRFEQFFKEKEYLKSVTKKTLIFYQDSMKAYNRTVGNTLPTKDTLKTFVISLRESGVSTARFCPGFTKTNTSFLLTSYADVSLIHSRKSQLDEPGNSTSSRIRGGKVGPIEELSYALDQCRVEPPYRGDHGS